MTIFEELFKAAATTGFKEQDKESDQDYLRALILAVSKVDDKTWDSLSRKAGEWFNAAANASNAMQPIPDCPGFKQTAAVPPPPPTPPPQVKKEPAKTSRTAPTTTKPKQRGPKQSGVIDAIRRAFILHPDWSTKQAYDELVKTYTHLAPETVAVNAGDIKHVIILAREMGFWNEEKYKELDAQQDQPKPVEGNAGSSGENEGK